MQTKASNPNK